MSNPHTTGTPAHTAWELINGRWQNSHRTFRLSMATALAGSPLPTGDGSPSDIDHAIWGAAEAVMGGA